MLKRLLPSFLSLSFLMVMASAGAQTTLSFNQSYTSIASWGASPRTGTVTLSDGITYEMSAVGGGSGVISLNGSGQLTYTMSTSHSYYSFGRADGSEFKFNSVELIFNISNTTSATLTGYKDGSAVSGATKSISFSQNVSQNVDISGNSSFSNIDEIRITFSISAPDNNATVQFNSLEYSDAVSASTSTITFDDQGFTDGQTVSTSHNFTVDGKTFNVYPANFDGSPSTSGTMYYLDGDGSLGWYTSDPSAFGDEGFVVLDYTNTVSGKILSS